ncbi:MAG: PAS domain-containing protein [Thermodesulfobacteriota bacterium]
MKNKNSSELSGDQSLSSERYKRLVEFSLDIVYIFSNKRGGVYWSPRVKEILGFEEDALINDSFLWYNSIHPDDKARVDQAIAEFEKGRGYSLEYRIKDTSGNWHWFFDRFIGKVIRGDEVIIEGLATDITRRKNGELALEEKNEELERLLAEIKTLRELIPICANCKKIKNDEGYWQQVEQYFTEHAKIEFSHGLCTECIDELYGEDEWYRHAKKKGLFSD